MKLIKKNIALTAFLMVGLFARSVASLNMVVQVTVAPKVTAKLPLCSLPLLQLLQPLLTLWVTQATLSAIPDFQMLEGLVLTYRNPVTGRVRMLRAEPKEEDNESARMMWYRYKKPATKIAPATCSSCSSAGCSQYCGAATCNLCGSSRRHLRSDPMSNSTDAADSLEEEPGRDMIEARDLAIIDFTALGVQVSETVQSLLQNFLLSTIFNLLGCLGDPLLLSTTVSFLVNQTFVP